MAGTLDPAIREMAGGAALPRRNGELVFDAPWEGRVFGMAVVLSDRAHYPWEAFRDHLIEQIAVAESAGEASGYYERWLAAFERLLVERGFVTESELSTRVAQFASGERDDVF